MTVPEPSPMGTADSRLIRIAIWTAIGALIAAAIVCFIWVLIGSGNGFIGRAFLTILLLAGFAGVALLETHLAPRRPAWFALTSMIVWVATLLIGALLIWLPYSRYGSTYEYEVDLSGSGMGRFMSFLLIVLVLQLALLHVRLYIKAYQRHVTPFSRAVAYVTVGLVAIIAVMLVLALGFFQFIEFGVPYWRWVVALTILAAVGTALIPLMNALFAPKKPRPAPMSYGAPALAPWPTYADGVTPLPVMPDGSPDWNAYYTGYPTTVSQAIAPVAPAPVPMPGEPYPGGPEQAGPFASPGAAPAPDGYQGYPPPPPLPPRP